MLSTKPALAWPPAAGLGPPPFEIAPSAWTPRASCPKAEDAEAVANARVTVGSSALGLDAMRPQEAVAKVAVPPLSLQVTLPALLERETLALAAVDVSTVSAVAAPAPRIEASTSRESERPIGAM
ncbi:MAG: hypothetical protein U0900_19025 [Myxococcota bacterium]